MPRIVICRIITPWFLQVAKFSCNPSICAPQLEAVEMIISFRLKTLCSFKFSKLMFEVQDFFRFVCQPTSIASM